MKRRYHSPQACVILMDTADLIAGSTHATIPNAGWDTSDRHTGATIPDAGWDNAASRLDGWRDYENN